MADYLTARQFQKKIEIARKTGRAELPDGCALLFFGYSGGLEQGFSIRNKDGGTIVSTYHPERYAFLFEK